MNPDVLPMTHGAEYPDALAEAVSLASRGIAVIPVRPASKRPSINSWPNQATIDPALLRSWFEQEPQSNLGIVTGRKSGLIVLDIDQKSGGYDSLRKAELAYGALPATPCVETGGGGQHRYFNYPVDRDKVGNRAGVGGFAGLDVRGDGGFVVAPPSIHESGTRYVWADGLSLDNVELARLPDSWLDLFLKGSLTAVTPLRPPSAIAEGSRNDTLFRRASALRGSGADTNEILDALRVLNLACSPSLEPDELQRIAESAMRYSPNLPPTDLGNARRLVAEHGSDIRHCPQRGKWLNWRDGYWRHDADADIERLMKSVADDMHRSAAAIDDHEVRKRGVGWALQTQSRTRLLSAVRLAETEPGIAVSLSEFDADQFSLNAQNGTIDLRTGKLKPPCRDDLITKACAARFDPSATCPRFEAFLDRIFDGNAELIAFIQRALGYAATGDTSEQCIFILHGSGANGKSLLLNTIRAVLGNYAMQAPAETFLAKPNGGGATNDLARLDGARMVTASELDDGRKMAEAVVKQITGGEPIAARYLFKEFFEYTPRCKIFLATNHRPQLTGSDDAIWRRVHQIPFSVVIPPTERDGALGAKLLDERGGILRWLVDGAMLWQRQGLQPPTSVRAATADYRRENDHIGVFLDEMCGRATTAQLRATDLHRAYSSWCIAEGHVPLSLTKFGRDLSRRGIGRTKINGNTWRTGLALLAPNQDAPVVVRS